MARHKPPKQTPCSGEYQSINEEAGYPSTKTSTQARAGAFGVVYHLPVSILVLFDDGRARSKRHISIAINDKGDHVACNRDRNIQGVL